MIRDESFDAIILDLRMPGMDGMQALERIKEYDANAIVVVITGYASIESAVEAMRRGAYDFLPKPFTPEALSAIVRRALDRHRLALENVCLHRELDGRMGRDAIVGRSAAMVRVAELVRKVAPTTARCSSTARRAPARSSSPGRSTARAIATTGRSWPWTAGAGRNPV